jgi:2-dehydro-3-deoxy-D-arabinonate dehydratase
MHLTRFADPDGSPVLAVVEDGLVHPLSVDVDELLRLPLVEIRELVDAALLTTDRVPTAAGTPLPPLTARTEVWGAGVTYERSRSARVEETRVADVYSLVYEAARPELFFKAAAWRVVTDGEQIGIREDSELSVPEPEVAVIANRFGEIVAYTICNDVTARSIEGENPLYLPQAKIYTGSCALHSAVYPAWEVAHPQNLAIRCTIRREGDVVWEASGSTSHMRRSFAELVDWAFRGQDHPDGLVLTTGTMLVPDMATTLDEGDLVEIEVERLGTLSNPVRRGHLPSLRPRISDDRASAGHP